MDPLSAIGLGVSAAGGLVNFFANQSAAQQAQTLANQNFQQWMALQLPNPADQRAAFQQLSSAGTLTPQLETQINQSNTAMQQIQTNAQTQAAQQNALNSLQQTGYQGGLNLQDRATIADAQSQNAQNAAGVNGALTQQLAQRGALNSGVGIAAQLSNNQNQVNANANASLNQAAQAQGRALTAIQGAGTLAGQMSAQDFQQQAQVAQAQDAINRFNTTNLQNVQQRNVASQNAAQAANLGNAQNILNSNVGITNAGITNNQNLNQAQYGDQVQQLQGATGASNQQAQAGYQGAAALGNFATNAANTANGALSTAANQNYWTNYFNQNKNSNNNGGGVTTSFGSGGTNIPASASGYLGG